ncbi:hypothetical protein B279_07510 [Streptococcus equinus ATCC 33317]|nr:hypothetical protein B279_07510 [Streptococcus equinus ATCC 33317]
MEDYKFAKEIADELNAKIIDNPKSLKELCGFISSLNYAIVTRLHSIVIVYLLFLLFGIINKDYLVN